MALILCPECFKQVSDKAEACPSCGFPIEQEKALQQIIYKNEYIAAQEQQQAADDFVIARHHELAVDEWYEIFAIKRSELNNIIDIEGASHEEAVAKHTALRDEFLEGKSGEFVVLFDDLIQKRAKEDYEKQDAERKVRCRRYSDEALKQQVNDEFTALNVKKAELRQQWHNQEITINVMMDIINSLVKKQLDGKSEEYSDLWHACYDIPIMVEEEDLQTSKKRRDERCKSYSDVIKLQVNNDFTEYKAKMAELQKQKECGIINYMEQLDKIDEFVTRQLEGKPKEYMELWGVLSDEEVRLKEAVVKLAQV